uniref:Testis cDNA, clone: QtsA-20439, similar to human cyclin B1 (CCNB1) n=1 Tax=Macaca fascicularis TaxID=9541 RepID=Q4R5V6_MACFA|nr:unnamed protein product [Macaca fascicularis]
MVGNIFKNCFWFTWGSNRCICLYTWFLFYVPGFYFINTNY